jgi:hypothetical protein
MSSLANWLPNYKQTYGIFTNPLPEENTIADFFQFVPQDQRPGQAFNFPVVVSLEQGQTADNTGTAFALNSAIDSVLKNATLDGSTLAMVGNIPYDVTFKGRNGAGDGRAGNAFKTAFELKTSLLMQSMEFYRELSLLYGCGNTGTIACDIGVVTTPITGGTITAGATITITAASWAAGIWNNMINAQVDVIATAGVTVNASKAIVTAVNPDLRTITLTGVGAGGSGGGYTPVAGDRLIPTGWQGKTCIGIEAICTNAGTIFGIPANQFPMWKVPNITFGSAAPTRSKILYAMSKLFSNGLDTGGKAFFAPGGFADLAEEADALQRFTGNGDEVRRQGTNNLEYKSPAGKVDVALHKYMKEGQAMFFSPMNGKRVGSTDITFRGEGQDWFFLELPSNAGCQIRCLSNQAPVLRMPYRCGFFNNILPSSGVSRQP